MVDAKVEPFYDANTSLDLPDLAEEINHWHMQAEIHAENAVKCACRSGQALIAAKDRLPHGEFRDWVETNFEGSYRTARRYMQLASNWPRVASLESDDLGEDGQAVPSINAALRAINPPEPGPVIDPDHLDKLLELDRRIDAHEAAAAGVSLTAWAERAPVRAALDRLLTLTEESRDMMRQLVDDYAYTGVPDEIEMCREIIATLEESEAHLRDWVGRREL